ncbi:hypothetical protein GEMRC1_003557 [Eukaryota sp. GEM-RC1]
MLIALTVSYLPLFLSSVFATARFTTFFSYQLQLFLLSFALLFKHLKFHSLCLTLSVCAGVCITFWNFIRLPLPLFLLVVVLLCFLFYIGPYLLASSLHPRLHFGISFPIFFSLSTLIVRVFSPWATQGIPPLASAGSLYVPFASLFGIDGLSYISSFVPCFIAMWLIHYLSTSRPSFIQKITDSHWAESSFPSSLLLILAFLVTSLFVLSARNSIFFANSSPVVMTAGVVLPRFATPEDLSLLLEFERQSIQWAFNVSESTVGNAEILVWSESMINVSIYSNGVNTEEELFNAASKFSLQHGIYLVVTYHLTSRNEDLSILNVTNNLAVFDPKGHHRGTYVKLNTVFVVENHITPSTPETKPLILETEHGVFGFLICHDLDFPSFVHHLSNVDVIFAPAWDQRLWARNTFGSTLRAAELGLSVVRVTFGGWSAVVQHDGQHVYGSSHFSFPLENSCPEFVEAMSPGGCTTAGVVTFTTPVPVKKVTTLYGIIGPLPVYLFFVTLAVLVVGLWYTTKPSFSQDENVPLSGDAVYH